MLEVVQSNELVRFRRITLGLAALSHCTLFLSFLRYFPRLYFMIRATRTALPRVLMFFLSTLPLFFGFVCFATIVFGPHSSGQFESFGWTAVSLFFMMYGDALLPAIRRAGSTRTWYIKMLANVFGVVYTFLFMGLALSIAMAVVIDTYMTLRTTFSKALEQSRSTGVDTNPVPAGPSGLLIVSKPPEVVRREAMQSILSGLERLKAATAEIDRLRATNAEEELREMTEMPM
jgi:hypothetical protein